MSSVPSHTVHFLDNPQVTKIFGLACGLLVHESDRGALLVATAIVDDCLGNLLKAAAPKSMSKNDRGNLFRPTGPLGPFGTRIDVAFLSRLIGEDLRDACNGLRKLRNKNGAHSFEEFSLENSIDEIRQIGELLGDGVPSFINETAGKHMINQVIAGMKSSEMPADYSGEWPPEDRDVIQTLRDNPGLMDELQIKSWRLELGLMVSILCGLLIFHQTQSAEVLGDSRLILSLNC